MGTLSSEPVDLSGLSASQVKELFSKLPAEQVDLVYGPLLEHIQEERKKELARVRSDMWRFVSGWCKSVHYHFEEAAYLGGQVDQTTEFFPDFPHVERTIKALERPRNTLIEKSRDMMATWMCSAVFLHDCMFQRGAQMLMASRVMDDVDDGGDQSTPDSLLGRIRFMYTHLPPWMQDEVPLAFKMRQIRNKALDTVIIGVKAKKNTGRQGKYRRSFADEFGFWDYGESNLAALRFGCQNGLILNSTPPEGGLATAFGRLANAGAPGFQVIRLHYSEHPLRQGDMGKKWYRQTTASMTPDQVARELEIDYEGAIEGRVYPGFDTDVHVLENIPYDSKFPLHLSFDHGLNEETCLFLQQRSNCPECGAPITLFIDEYQGGFAQVNRKQTVWENRDHIVDEILANPPYEIARDALDHLVNMGFCTGDPAGKKEEVQLHGRKTDDTKLTSWHAVYRQRGIRIRSKFSRVKDGTTMVRNAMTPPCGHPHMFVAEKCRKLWDAIINNRFKPLPGAGPDGRTRFSDDAIHDWTSHYCDALRYWFVNTESVTSLNRPKVRQYRQVWMPGARYPKMVLVTE
ncbi:MAG TPA: hypothetical protein VMZ50_14520 [Phycisphaerae bacterium]|nr:hypothetical protein [Phycisphaerae bacterium]